MKVHPVTKIFPMMSRSEFQSFKNDVAKHGVLVPVVVSGDVLLDGRNRLRAAEKLGIECPQEKWKGRNGQTEAEWIISHNLERRNLDQSQRAMVATEYADYLAKTHAKEQMAEGGRRGGTVSKKGKRVASNEATLKKKPAPKSTALAAQKTGSSTTSVERAVRIKKANPKIAKMVTNDGLTLGAAERILKDIPEKDQLKVAKQASREGIGPALRDYRDEGGTQDIRMRELGDILESSYKYVKTLRGKFTRAVAILDAAPDMKLSGEQWKMFCTEMRLCMSEYKRIEKRGA